MTATAGGTITDDFGRAEPSDPYDITGQQREASV
jgi:hypothetical protein